MFDRLVKMLPHAVAGAAADSHRNVNEGGLDANPAGLSMAAPAMAAGQDWGGVP
jgi:hypothetical protein